MTMRNINETDWKRWSSLAQLSLQRYCESVLTKSATYLSGAGTPHDRYLELYTFVREADKEIEQVFNNRRRSSAYRQLAAAVSQGIVTREELGQFSDETQQIIRLLLGED